MSLILDALNKADNERKKSAGPSLASLHATGEDPRLTRRNRIIIFSLSLSVIVLASLLLTLLLRDKSAPAIAQQASEHSQAKPATASTSNPVIPGLSISNTATSHTATPKPATAAAEAQPADKTATQVDTSSETYKQMQQKLIAEQYRQANQATDEQNKAAAKPETDNKIASIYQQSQVSPTPKPSPAAASIPTPVPTALPVATQLAAMQEAIQEVTPAPTPTPIIIEPQGRAAARSSSQSASTASNFTGRKTLSYYPTLSTIGELPFSIQKNIPTIMYSEHHYSTTNPSVTLNNTKRTNGQQIATDLFLEEILEDGIILRYQSKKFKMAAMNSWINI